MKRQLTLCSVLLLALLVGSAAAAPPSPWRTLTTPVVTSVDEDPDLPGGLGEIDKGEYMQARDNFYWLRFSDATFDQIYNGRLTAIRELQSVAKGQAPFTAVAPWSAIGPYPIPNGQTTAVSTPVSGRVTAIAVHPTDPNTVYVGTAQGGVWRSLNGGVSWTPLFDNAASLAIGSLALAPTDPTILYVGTGEANLSADSFFGVGLYRIDNADTAPVLNGPFNPVPTTDIIGARTFSGRAISKILVDRTDAATIFVSTASGIGGLGGDPLGASPPITGLRGIYRCTNATSGSPSFEKLTVTPSSSIAPDVTGNLIVLDMAYDPADATWNTIVCWVYGANSATNGGIYRTTTAKGAATFTQQFITTVANSRGAFAVTFAGSVTTMYATTGETAAGTGCTTGSGCLRKSVDGGITWGGKLVGGGGFCGGQCFYDVPIAVSPTDANLVLIGGAGNGTCSRVYARSTNGGASFTGAGGADVGLHADAHAIEFAPSDPSIVYEGNDGGIWKSVDGGQTWVSLNTAGLSATQFQSIDVHPTDTYFSIGGTQDNGTPHYTPLQTWNRIDFGDGGFAVIDQNAPDNVNVRMYHTYFNQRNNLVGYARVLGIANAFDGNWTLLGSGNGLAISENPNFYAPLVRGPGNPNTVYYATDRLHRSIDQGTTNPVVSQAPIQTVSGLGVPISAVAIAPSNDNVRLVGLNPTTVNQIWGTTTGSSTLTNMTQAGMPNKYIGRFGIDPTDPNIAYVCFGGFGLNLGEHVWKTTNLMSGTPTWSASGTGLPDVPVNALAIDPLFPTTLFAGTDVGVYISGNGGATWVPFTTGMPVVAVFDIKLQPTSRILRIATHGRGMWERQIDTTVPVEISLIGAEIVNGHPRMTWQASADARQSGLTLYRRDVPGDWARVDALRPDAQGWITYDDLTAEPRRSYEYRIGVLVGGNEIFAGQVWVDMPAATVKFALRSLSGNPARGKLLFSVQLPAAGSATIDLFDVKGRRIASREITVPDAGTRQVGFETRGLSSGVYWARLVQSGKMISTRVSLIN